MSEAVHTTDRAAPVAHDVRRRLRGVRGAVITSVLALAAVVMITGGIAHPSAADRPPTPDWTSSGTGDGSQGGLRVALRMPTGTAVIDLENTAAARSLTAALPVSLTLHDPMGQAKSGTLPAPLIAQDTERVFDPVVGGVYYWPPSGAIGIFYDDLGQTVPPPGLIRLGTVHDGIQAVAAAGRRTPASLVPF